VKLVRALRKGWIKTTAERMVSQQERPVYLLWEDDGLIADKTATGGLRPGCCACPMSQGFWQEQLLLVLFANLD
jgi:hypothetical protein